MEGAPSVAAGFCRTLPSSHNPNPKECFYGKEMMDLMVQTTMNMEQYAAVSQLRRAGAHHDQSDVMSVLLAEDHTRYYSLPCMFLLILGNMIRLYSAASLKIIARDR